MRINKAMEVGGPKPEVWFGGLFCGMPFFFRWRHLGPRAHDFHRGVSRNVTAKLELKPWLPKAPGHLPPDRPGCGVLVQKQAEPCSAPQGGLSRGTADTCSWAEIGQV